MGNALKAVATGGLSLLPGKAGKIASAIGTGGASLLPGKAGRIAGGMLGDPTAIFGGGQYRKRGTPPIEPMGAPMQDGGGIPEAIAGGGGGGFINKAMPGGLVSQLVNPAVGAAAPNPLLKQVAASVGKAMGNPNAMLGGGTLAPAAGQQLPKPNMQAAQRMNPAEVATRRRVSRRG